MNLKDMDFPPGWEVKPINEVYRMTKKPRNLQIGKDDIIPFFPMEVVPIGKLFVRDYVPKSPEKLTSGTYIENGDLLIAKITPSFENGKQAIAQFDQAFGYATTEVIPFQDIQGVSDKLYLYFALLHPEIRSNLAGQMDGTTGRQRLSKEVLGKALIPFPPLPEQQKIAHILAAVQNAIEQQERLIALTTELKKTLMRKLFTEGLRGEPQKETEIGLVPQSWEAMPLQRTGEVIYGIQASVANNLKPIGTKILTNKNITLDGQIDLEAINYFELRTKRHLSTILKHGDLLFNWRSGSKEHVGKTAYFDLEGEYTHSSFILRIRPNKNVNGRFLYYYLNLLRETGYFVRRQTYAVNAKFNKSAVDALPTFMPLRNEQDEIASALDCVNAKIQTAEHKSRLLNELFRTLLHQLMTAQIRVNDLDLRELAAPLN